MYHNAISIYKGFSYLIIVISSFALKASAQCIEKDFLTKTSIIDKNTTLTGAEKLEQFYSLKNLFNRCKFQPDSIYSAILLKIDYYEVYCNKNFDIGIAMANEAVRINTNNKGGSKYLTTKAYYHLAAYYYQFSLFDKALKYFDSTIITANSFPDTTNYIIQSRLYKAYIYFQIGDYQKAIEESTSGIYTSLQKKDSTHFLELLTQRAQSLYYENNFKDAFTDVNTMIKIAEKNNALYELASALKIKAIIFQKNQQFKASDSLFKKAIAIRIKTGDFEQVSRDYIDYGNFYIDTLHYFERAKFCYLQTINHAKKINDSSLLAKANTNLAELYLRKKDFLSSFKYIHKAFAYLNTLVDNIYQNPMSSDLCKTGINETIIVLINNKIEALLNIFITKKDNNALKACMQTCFIMDTLINKMRNGQTGNQSKLYWRNYTKDFYSNAIRASFLANNPDAAFYFMEKSRAVLLNDKLNELNAASYLSKTDAAKQEDYEIRIIELQQKMSVLPDTSKQYHDLQLRLLNTKNDYEQFIKSLEQKYPVYYQYKYADNVPTLKALQLYLTKNNQNFVHYFFADTATYILAITANNTKFIKLTQNEFNKDELTGFIKLCSDKKALNNNYHSFALLSNSIYKKIFQPLQLPEGRVVICTENTVIPFEALCADKTGKHFLLNDYSFSYAYAAGFLMKQFNNPPAKGNFIGFAPVSFNKTLGVVDLKNAASALNASASFYNNDKLFTYSNASRRNFFTYAPSYSVVSIFSHAYADTTDNEPVLFMQDSLIHLSELQSLNNPATKLVLLSACQTNVGKNATGEGIYSLARGFASAGIPSVAATLWKADEETIYAISEKFNEYLAEGMNKDEALQKAKSDFIQANSSEKMLPYYWANMILIGNADTVNLNVSSGNSNNKYLWLTAIIIIILPAGFLFFKMKHR
ncbi:CHAT domain-containing protein [Parafilimonas sp.]|uniref:CHAT domain-containing protein n=1 Tax=Parafilimonas sp. TaxID=1969739 RepID=UPI0039E5822E